MIKSNKCNRDKIKIRIRRKVQGTTERPRLAVYKSLKQIYVQFIDDSTSKTITSASSLSKEIVEQVKSAKTKTDKSIIVGKFAAVKAAEFNIKTVVFDRNGFRYHGRVKALADGAREGGLLF